MEPDPDLPPPNSPPPPGRLASGPVELEPVGGSVILRVGGQERARIPAADLDTPRGRHALDAAVQDDPEAAYQLDRLFGLLDQPAQPARETTS